MKKLLLILGAPLWLPLILAALAVAASLLVALWSVIIALFAVPLSLSACSLFVFLLGLVYIFANNTMGGIALIGVGLVCAGLAIFAFLGFKAAVSGAAYLTKALFVRKNER